MQIVNKFGVELTISTFNVGDKLEWVPFRQYKAPPNSRIYVHAHDNGRCKVRIDWGGGARELGVLGENDTIALMPPPPTPRSDTDREDPPEGADELSSFLREHWEEVRRYHLELPWHKGQGSPQQPE